MDPPGLGFCLFGMRNRRKLPYRDGPLLDLFAGEPVRRWNAEAREIDPVSYSVRLTTNSGEEGVISEDVEGVWIQESALREPLTGGPDSGQ